MYVDVENKHIGRTQKFWILIPLTISSLIIELVFSKQQTSMCYNQEEYMITSNGGLPFHIGTSNIKLAGREVPNRFLCLSMYATGQTLICYKACDKHSLMSRIFPCLGLLSLLNGRLSRCTLPTIWILKGSVQKDGMASQCDKQGVDNIWEFHWQLW